MRLVLQTQAPEISLDLIDSWLNERYEAVLESTDWIGLKGHATIQSQAAYQSVTDTVTATVGSNAIAGLTTAWTSAITGQKFYIPGDTATYLATYVGATSLTLDRPYEGNGSDPAGTVYTKSPYVFMQNIYTLPPDCSSVVTVLDPITELPLVPFTKDGLDQSVGARTLVGYPQSWAQYDDSPETSPPQLHQIELYPPPLYARGFPLEYRRVALGFDGGNTAGTPLLFVSNSVLLNGARAQIQLHLKDYKAAAEYAAAYVVDLNALLLVEHTQRRVKAALKMADRFTRHRMQRAARGLVSAWRGGTLGGPT
jgi:hypothetical protein